MKALTDMFNRLQATLPHEWLILRHILGNEITIRHSSSQSGDYDVCVACIPNPSSKVYKIKVCNKQKATYLPLMTLDEAAVYVRLHLATQRG